MLWYFWCSWEVNYVSMKACCRYLSFPPFIALFKITISLVVNVCLTWNPLFYFFTEHTSVTVRISWVRLRRSSPRECPTCWRRTRTGSPRSTRHWPSRPLQCTTRRCSQSWSRVWRAYSRVNTGRTEMWVPTYWCIINICWKSNFVDFIVKLIHEIVHQSAISNTLMYR